MGNEIEVIEPQQNDVLENLISKGTSNADTKSNLEVLKELFSEKEIRMKTDLNVNAVILVNQKRAISRLLYWEDLNETVTDFMTLLVSKDRKGRAEFVDGFKAERNQPTENKGFLSNLKDKIF
jgi:hypothetical protein